MQLWCSAQTAAWDWGWQAYPGVWLLVGALAFGYLRLLRGDGENADGAGAGLGDRAAGMRGRPVWAVVGLGLLWISLDWPVGPLGAGYLASVHMAQVLVLSLLVPGLLLLGVPPVAFERLEDRLLHRPLGRRLLKSLTHPIVALLLYNGIVIGTHVPAVLDTLSASQLGMFGMDVAWIGAGLVFWWPVLAPVPRRPWFGWFLKMGYLFLNTVPVTVPYSFLVFADFPLYATYELAPPYPGIDTLTDQQVAGLLMKIGGGLILWTAITLLFWRWYREEGGPDETAAAARGG